MGHDKNVHRNWHIHGGHDVLIKVNEASCKYVVKHKSVSVIARVGGGGGTEHD